LSSWVKNNLLLYFHIVTQAAVAAVVQIVLQKNRHCRPAGKYNTTAKSCENYATSAIKANESATIF
jgi:hypothetical protein